MRPRSRTARVVTKETEFDTSPERLFDAFVVPDVLERWMARRAWTDPRPDGRWLFEFGPDNGGRIGGHYVIVDRPWRLVWTWNEWEIDDTGRPLDPDPAADPPWAVTVCDLAIVDTGHTARLMLRHHGYPDMPEWDDLFTGVNAGWDELLEKLRPLVEPQARISRSATITANIPARYQIE
jgi:uncharacterized protein YndB with AHSA1/START domain